MRRARLVIPRAWRGAAPAARRAALVACLAAAVAAAAAGCGSDSEAGGETVVHSVTRDFGSERLSPRRETPLEGHRTVMRQLKAHSDVDTSLEGRVVQSIDGLRQRRENLDDETVWAFYVNGFDADEFPSDYRLHPGDVVHWDLREWDTGTSVRATVGAFPQTFTQGMYGRRFPVTVECERPASAACRRVKDELRQAGVRPDGSRPPGPRPPRGQPRQGRILVGRWQRFRERPWPRRIDDGPNASGVFARFTPDGRAIELLDWERGQVGRVGAVGPGSGLVAAMQPTEEHSLWVVTGVDDEGVERAARAFNSRDLRDAFAVVATRDGLERVPQEPLDREEEAEVDIERALRERARRGTPPSPPSVAREAAAYAPLVLLDRAEPWAPIAARPLLRRSVLWWADEPRCGNRKIAVGLRLREQWTTVVDWIYLWGLGRGPTYYRSPSDKRCESVPGGRTDANEVTRPHELPGRAPIMPLDEGFYLDIDDRWLRRTRGRRPAADAPVYVERRREDTDDGPGVRLSYWMLFPMREPPAGAPGAGRRPAREGDWQRVDVLLVRAGGEGEPRPASLALYDAHGTRREIDWAAVRRVGGTAGDADGAAAAATPAAANAATHPVLAAARGTHSLSTSPCPDCRAWRTWRNVGIARNQRWYGFGGAWGAAGPTSATTGPLGPRGLPLMPPERTDAVRGSARGR